MGVSWGKDWRTVTKAHRHIFECRYRHERTQSHTCTLRGGRIERSGWWPSVCFYIISSRHFTHKKSIISVYFSPWQRPPGAGIRSSQELIIHPNRTMSAVSAAPRANRCLGEFTFPVQARMTGSDVTGQLRLGSGCHILAVYGVSLLCLRRGLRVLGP